MTATISAPSRPVGVPVNDHLRGLGAFIDLVVSVGFFVLGILMVDQVAQQFRLRNELMPGQDALAIMLAYWAADIAVYAGAVAVLGGSIGNLLTRRRTVDAETGRHLTFPRAARRYFGRRRLLSAAIQRTKRDQMQIQESDWAFRTPAVPFAGPPVVDMVMGGLYASLEQRPGGPTQSVADRGAHSVVVKSHTRG